MIMYETLKNKPSIIDDNPAIDKTAPLFHGGPSLEWLLYVASHPLRGKVLHDYQQAREIAAPEVIIIP